MYDTEFQCMCCYCESKSQPYNEEYIRGLKFAAEFVRDELGRLQESVDCNRKNNRDGKITDRQLRNYNNHCQSQMRYLGQWHDIIAKEGNKCIKPIKDIDWKEYLYGDHEQSDIFTSRYD